jgi:hypothetical protein
MSLWIGFIWLKIVSGSELYKQGNEPSDSIDSMHFLCSFKSIGISTRTLLHRISGF